jgi:hypothetical protein
MPVKNIEIYRSENVKNLQWPDGDDADYVKKFFCPMVEKGVPHFIENVNTDFRLLKLDNLILPIMINSGKKGMSYVCSPYDFYITYGSKMLSFIKNPVLRLLVEGIHLTLSKVINYKEINHVVLVNNWPFSTTFYPEITELQINAIVAHLSKEFPNHAIAFRSINPNTTKECYDILKKCGFDLIASRQVYYTNPGDPKLSHKQILKSDLKLYREREHQILKESELSKEDLEGALSLYNQLYIDKFSFLNPQIKETFLKLGAENKLLELRVLKKDGRIDGVVGFICKNGYLYCPFFGYNTSNPDRSKLYRLLSTILFLEAKERGLVLFQSAGASFFKKIRGASDCLEYLAVYKKHLSFPKKFSWMALKAVANSIGGYFMRKY